MDFDLRNTFSPKEIDFTPSKYTESTEVKANEDIPKDDISGLNIIDRRL